MPSDVDLSALVTAHGVRGTVPGELDVEVVRALGTAFAESVLDDAEVLSPPRVVVGRDMRESGVALQAAFVEGLTSAGADVVDLGLASTETLCFASASLAAPAAIVTAGHCEAGKNGVKLWSLATTPIGPGTGLEELCARATQVLRGEGPPGPPVARAGEVVPGDVLADYARHLRSVVDLAGIRPLKVVVDAGNGMAGLTVPAVLGEGANRAVELVPVFFDLDGRFPFHDADPAAAVNLLDLQTAVVANHADLGIAFDGDADRCLVVDERGAVVSTSAVMVLVGLQLLDRARAEGQTVTMLHTPVVSRAVPEILGGSGARTVPLTGPADRVAARMLETDAVLAGAPRGRLHYRDFFGCDSGMLTALYVVAAVGNQTLAFSELVEIVEPYSGSGAVASRVADASAALERVVEAYVTNEGAGAVEVDKSDGLLVSHWDEIPRWWFHLRVDDAPTGPGGRSTVWLVVEAADEDIMDKVRDDVLALVRELDPAPEGEDETDE